MDHDWWRHAVIYQTYIRSFADADGDGLGDIPGLRSRIGYLAELGVDGIWINPWYPSPMVDAGYDVADYRDVHPALGTMDDADALIADCHAAGLKVLLDLVPNHTSDQHEWFQAALAAGPGSSERDRYVFRPGRGDGGDLPPNNWQSHFGGDAWTRVKGPDGSPEEWYLHLFAPEQPDLNWSNPDVGDDFERTLRFWFDRGVDGFRIDVAHALTKDPSLRDLVEGEGNDRPSGDDHPFLDRTEVHDVYRRWRRVADEYDPPRVFAAEAWVGAADRSARYVRPDELHTAFAFDLLDTPWLAPQLREAIATTLDALDQVGAPATWVLSNHDVVRHVSRYARPQDQVGGHDLQSLIDLPADLDVGTRRARAALLLLLALPGTVYLYQGEELGLPEVEDLPDDALEDPTWFRSQGAVRGRDGCRVPLPWSGDAPPFGFSPDGGADPWLPQPPAFAALTAERQDGDPDAMLELYRSALRLRAERDVLRAAAITWNDGGRDEVLSFDRGGRLRCVVNLGTSPARLPDGEVVLASGELDVDGALTADTAVWLDLDA